MTTLAIALGSLILYLIAYNTYGKWLGSKIFNLQQRNLPNSAVKISLGTVYALGIK